MSSARLNLTIDVDCRPVSGLMIPITIRSIVRIRSTSIATFPKTKTERYGRNVSGTRQVIPMIRWWLVRMVGRMIDRFSGTRLPKREILCAARRRRKVGWRRWCSAEVFHCWLSVHSLISMVERRLRCLSLSFSLPPVWSLKSWCNGYRWPYTPSKSSENPVLSLQNTSYLSSRFGLLLLNQFASGLTASTFSLIFILMLELTSSAHTSFAGNSALVSFTIGEGIVTLFAYIARDWQALKWANTVFVGLILPYLYFMPESPLYIYSKRHYDQLEVLLRRIAKVNRRADADWYPAYQELCRTQPIIVSHGSRVTVVQKLRQILTHRPTVVKLLITALLGFTTLMLYIKISYGLAVMDISPYLGILIGAVVEALGYVTGSLLINTRLARKGSFIFMMVLTIICVTLIPIILPHSSFGTVCIAQFGKYSISGAIAVSWIFVPELFPTSIRSSANGFFIAFSRLGAIVAPIITAAVNADTLPYTFYASSALAVVVLLLSLLLPETKDKPMDDVQDYAVSKTVTWFFFGWGFLFQT